MSGSNTPESPGIVAICGPTGSGKSDLALRLAARVSAEIVNFDSVQIYRGFDIGSAKPGREVRERVAHHLIDEVEPTELFTAADFAERAEVVCRMIGERGKIPLLIGGTGFYLRALLAGLPDLPARDDVIRGRIRRVRARPRGSVWLHRWLKRVDVVTAGRVAEADSHRVERALEVWMIAKRPISTWPRPGSSSQERMKSVKFALSYPRELLREKLDLRVRVMYDNGLVDETRSLLDRYPETCRAFDSIGYRESVRVIRCELSIDEAIEETRRRTRAYAKRQMTWLRNEKGIRWVDMTKGIDWALDEITTQLAVSGEAGR